MWGVWVWAGMRWLRTTPFKRRINFKNFRNKNNKKGRREVKDFFFV